MLDNSTWPVVCDVLVSRDFYRHDHQLIFDAISDLLGNDEPADAVTVSELLASKDLAQQSGGLAYLAGLVRDTPTAANVGAYAAIVAEKSKLRGVIRLGDDLAARGYEPEGRSATELLDQAKDRVTQLGRVPLASRKNRRPMQWRELAEREPPPRIWHMQDWLSTTPTLFAGGGGIGKTLLAQTMATALALGRAFLEAVSRPTTVLMWCCEDEHDELWRRQIAICKYFGVHMSELGDRLIIQPRAGLDNVLMTRTNGAVGWTRVREELREEVRDYGASVLFLDNARHLFLGDESDGGQVTTFVNGLAGLGPAGAFTPVVLAHPARSSGSEFAGSAAWENSVRMRWFLSVTRPDAKLEDEPVDDNVRYISKRKANYAARDCIRLTRKDGVLAPEVVQEKLFQKYYGGGLGNRKEDAESCVLDGLAKLVHRQIRTTAAQNTGDYLPKKMREAGLAADFSPKELGDALARMRLDGRIVEASGQFGHYANRMPKSGLVPATRSNGPQSAAQSDCG